MTAGALDDHATMLDILRVEMIEVIVIVDSKLVTFSKSRGRTSIYRLGGMPTCVIIELAFVTIVGFWQFHCLLLRSHKHR